MNVMRTGQGNRSVGFTNMNAESSRSHSLFVVNVTQKDLRTGGKRNGKLYLVDLAGSEKVGKTGAQGTTLEEAKMINKSLSALGNVINALTDGKSKHVPYRDSKLTRVLQESIGGNSRTTLIVNCSPDSSNELETLSTLRFGTRAKSIKNKAQVNEERSVAEWKAICNKLQQEIIRLRKYIETLEQELGIVKQGGTSELAATLQAQVTQTSSGPTNPAPSGTTGALHELHEQIRELEKQVGAKEEALNTAQEAKSILMDQLSEKQSEFDAFQQQLEEAENRAQEAVAIVLEYEEEQKTLIAQVAQKDFEIESLTASSLESATVRGAQQLEIEKLVAEKELLTEQLNRLADGNKARQRSLSSQSARSRSSSLRLSLTGSIPRDSVLSHSAEPSVSPLAKMNSAEPSLPQDHSNSSSLSTPSELEGAVILDWNRRNDAVRGLHSIGSPL